MDKKVIIPDDLNAKYNDWHFSPAIESSGFVFVAGCTGTNLDGSISTDPIEQFTQAFKTVEKSLVKAGIGFQDVVDMTTYHVGLKNHLDAFKLIKDQFVPEPFPAWTAIGVSELATTGGVIEIKVIAKANSK